MNVRKSKENLDLRAAFNCDLAESRPWKLEKGARNYFSLGRYEKFLNLIYDYFGKDRTHIVIFEDLIDDPAGELTSVAEFLGISRDVPLNLPLENPSSWLKTKGLARVYSRFPGKKMISGILPDQMKERLRSFRDSIIFGHKRPDLDPCLALEISDYYRDTIVELEDMLGKRLEAWRRSPLFHQTLGT
jgi:hypothetical protein